MPKRPLFPNHIATNHAARTARHDQRGNRAIFCKLTLWQAGGIAQLGGVLHRIWQIAGVALGVLLGKIGLESPGELVTLLVWQVVQRIAHRLGERGDLRCDGHVHAASPDFWLASNVFMVVENSDHTLRCRSSVARPCALIP